MADNWYELDIHLSKTDKNNIKKYNIYSEENYNENLNKKFLALRYDGFGGRMMALLNAMYCSKKFHLPFVFNWSTKGVEYYKNIDGLGNKVLGIDVGKVEEIFSQDFIQQYFVPDEITWQFGYKDISFNGIKWKVINEGFDPYRKNKNFHFKDLLYYKSETPLGWIMPFDSLLNIFKDINKDEYKKIIKDCWNDIGFSKEFSEIIQKVDAAVQDKGKFITIHVRSGDIIYRSPWYIYKYKALVLELAVEIIVQELPNYNVVLLGDDITSLERTIEFSLQAIKERSIDCHGHSIIFAKDLIEDNIYIYNGIQYAFYDSYVLSKGEKIFISSHSAFSLFSSFISNANDISSCYEYFSKEEQFNIIKKYIEKLNLISVQKAFSYWHLLDLAKELGKPFEEQLEYANSMLKLSDHITMKAYYGYFLLENNRLDLFYEFIQLFSLNALIGLIKFILNPYFKCPSTSKYLKKFLFRILTSENVRKNRYTYRIKRSLKGAEKEWFDSIYKNIFFRNRVHLYNFVRGIFH